MDMLQVYIDLKCAPLLYFTRTFTKTVEHLQKCCISALSVYHYNLYCCRIFYQTTTLSLLSFCQESLSCHFIGKNIEIHGQCFDNQLAIFPPSQKLENILCWYLQCHKSQFQTGTSCSITKNQYYQKSLELEDVALSQ